MEKDDKESLAISVVEVDRITRKAREAMWRNPEKPDYTLEELSKRMRQESVRQQKQDQGSSQEQEIVSKGRGRWEGGWEGIWKMNPPKGSGATVKLTPPIPTVAERPKSRVTWLEELNRAQVEESKRINNELQEALARDLEDSLLQQLEKRGLPEDIFGPRGKSKRWTPGDLLGSEDIFGVKMVKVKLEEVGVRPKVEVKVADPEPGPQDLETQIMGATGRRIKW